MSEKAGVDHSIVKKSDKMRTRVSIGFRVEKSLTSWPGAI